MHKDYDIIIIGAGISGINSAYRIQTRLPGSSYTILEARADLGGTWDLFRYPGIRSDSDMYSFGFPWRPWTKNIIMASGSEILNYMKESAAMYGIDQHIEFHRKLVGANWSTEQQMWALNVTDSDGGQLHYNAKFLILASGYYNYDTPLPAVISGLENFKGKVIHPQFWPKELNYEGKEIAIVGSGATAITLLPSLAEKASSVTMIQRSPTYVLGIKNTTPLSWAKRLLPEFLYTKYIRISYVITRLLFYLFCQAFPSFARKSVLKRVQMFLPPNVPLNPHFEPRYNPWDQRFCLSPGADIFKALRGGKAKVATDIIKTMTEDSVILESGQSIRADILVTATGLNLMLGGTIRFSIDGEEVKLSDTFCWNSMMFSGVPNIAYMWGYTHASWTLGADVTIHLICRLLKYMEKNGITSVVPKVDHPEKLTIVPTFQLKSSYITKAESTLPKSAIQFPWQPRVNYFSDMFQAKYGDFKTGLQFIKVSK